MALLPDTSPRDAEAVALRLQQTLRQQSVSEAEQQTPLTVSIGIVSLKAVESAVEALRQADAALYQAKEQGRDCTVIA